MEIGWPPQLKTSAGDRVSGMEDEPPPGPQADMPQANKSNNERISRIFTLSIHFGVELVAQVRAQT